MYVFGFDNTLVNTEDLIVEITNKVLGIDMSLDFWYANLHSVTDMQTEHRILEEAFGVNYTPDLQQQTGAMFVQALTRKAPNETVYRLVKEHISDCHFLSGSPMGIMLMYFKAWNIDIPEEHIHAGVYNGSGDKERILTELQKQEAVIFVDDDAGVVRNASAVVKEVFLVRQPYNKKAWNEFKTIE